MHDNCKPQLNADCIAQVHFLSFPLRLQPLRHNMSLHSRLGAVWPKLPAILHPEPVEPGGDVLANPLVVVADPCVQLLNVSQDVGVAEPTELGWVQKSCYHQLVCNFRMVGFCSLFLNCMKLSTTCFLDLPLTKSSIPADRTIRMALGWLW